MIKGKDRLDYLVEHAILYKDTPVVSRREHIASPNRPDIVLIETYLISNVKHGYGEGSD